MSGRLPHDTGDVPSPPIGLPQWLGPFLFMAMTLFLWIGITPFYDLTGEAVLDPSAGNSNRLNQIVVLSLTIGLFLYGAFHPMRGAILRPRLLLGTLFIWFFAVSLISTQPTLGIKGIVIALLMTANASIYLLLPASERQFGRMFGIAMLAMLALSYYGIVFKPALAIHQASELREPMNAGLWRGHFPHKNAAAVAMVIAIFVGLYVMRAWSRLAGLVIVALAVTFLIHTGGKTASAMAPFIIVVAFVFEKFRWLRALIVIGGVAGFNLLAVGSAVWRPLGKFISDLGIDATFTNRTDIWRFAFDAIARQPVTGYGFKGFWQTKELVYSGSTIETWAAAAANGHNSYLDILLMTGAPGLLLTLAFLLFLPLRDLGRIAPEEAKSPLIRLFTRIWLYALFNAGLESFFFEGGNFVWFTLVAALCGLRMQSRATLAVEKPRPAFTKVEAHA